MQLLLILLDDYGMDFLTCFYTLCVLINAFLCVFYILSYYLELTSIINTLNHLFDSLKLCFTSALLLQ